MRVARGGGLGIHYVVAGDGPPLVLHHGFSGSLQRWTLARNRWRQLDVVVADDAESAERRFFDRWAQKQHGIVNDQQAVERGAPPPTRDVHGLPFSQPPGSGIIGLFPEPGGPR